MKRLKRHAAHHKSFAKSFRCSWSLRFLYSCLHLQWICGIERRGNGDRAIFVALFFMGRWVGLWMIRNKVILISSLIIATIADRKWVFDEHLVDWIRCWLRYFQYHEHSEFDVKDTGVTLSSFLCGTSTEVFRCKNLWIPHLLTAGHTIVSSIYSIRCLTWRSTSFPTWGPIKTLFGAEGPTQLLSFMAPVNN